MQEVLNRIEQCKAQYANSPFLRFLQDPTIDPRQKLAFAPHVAHFVLTFGDLCVLILPEDPPRDRAQELVNANSREDDGHWRWYLTDLATLGLDTEAPYSHAIRLIWGPAAVRTRRLSYYLCHYGLAADSVGRLALVHCIEGAFQVTVRGLEPAARQFVEMTKKPLHYLGARHSDAEISHTLELPEVRREITAMKLDPGTREKLFEIVDKCYELFAAFADEMLELAQNPTPMRPIETNRSPRA